MITKADISLVRSLIDKKNRSEHGLFVVEGRKLVEEALNSDFNVMRIIGIEEFSSIRAIEVVSPKDFGRMSTLKTPQGILALVEIPHYTLTTPAANELVIALDGIQDPGNIGTIIRTADWFGINDIVCSPETVDCFNPKVVQASMGALLRVRVHYAPLVPFLAAAASRGDNIYGTFLDGENIYTVNIERKTSGIIVMGNEGNGISPEVAAMVTQRLLIPPYPLDKHTCESLNVATSMAIICSEFRRLSI